MTRLHHDHRAIGRRAVLLSGLTATVAIAGAVLVRPAPAADGAQAASVEIRNFAFVPAQLTVAAGTRVVWTNRDEDAHAIASADGAFKPSPALDTNESYAAVFGKPGTYAYFCSIHPMMRGTIVVE